MEEMIRRIQPSRECKPKAQVRKKPSKTIRLTADKGDGLFLSCLLTLDEANIWARQLTRIEIPLEKLLPNDIFVQDQTISGEVCEIAAMRMSAAWRKLGGTRSGLLDAGMRTAHSSGLIQHFKVRAVIRLGAETGKGIIVESMK